MRIEVREQEKPLDLYWGVKVLLYSVGTSFVDNLQRTDSKRDTETRSVTLNHVTRQTRTETTLLNRH